MFCIVTFTRKNRLEGVPQNPNPENEKTEIPLKNNLEGTYKML